jgi:GR25 family glycosyltransferase involved in LPS biosynthesis
MEKTIDLTTTTNYVINVDSSVDSLLECSEVLSDLKIPFERFSANTTSASPNPYGAHFVGCALSHLTLLKNMKPNTVVFEDDIVPTQFVKTQVTVPEDTDMVYLGVSTYGTVRNNNFAFPGIVMASQETESMKRVYNMCGTHAMLFLTQRYIDAAIEVIESFLNRLVPCDVALASIQKDFKILTPNDPFFYQKDQPEVTNFSLQV